MKSKIFLSKIFEKQRKLLKLENSKKHKALGVFKKYANNDIRNKEKDIIGDAIIERYIR